jgi:hypothetical protein
MNASRTNERRFGCKLLDASPVSEAAETVCYWGCCSAAGAGGVCDVCFKGASLFGSVGRITRAKSDSISCKLIGHSERAGAGAAATGFDEPGEDVDALAEESAAGTFSVGFVSAAAGVFSNGTVGPAAVVSLGVVPPSFPAGALVLCAGEESILPRISGNPSLALPITTTFEFVDWAS